jgi:hypothetical protein
LEVKVRGAFTKFLFLWPQTIKHDHQDIEKAKRYNIGKLRLRSLRNHADFFAYKAEEQGQIVAFLSAVSPHDLHRDMPNSTRWEYLAGKIDKEKGTCIVFAYIWFASLAVAKKYVLRHGMTIQGGWNAGEAQNKD